MSTTVDPDLQTVKAEALPADPDNKVLPVVLRASLFTLVNEPVVKVGKISSPTKVSFEAEATRVLLKYTP